MRRPLKTYAEFRMSRSLAPRNGGGFSLQARFRIKSVWSGPTAANTTRPAQNSAIVRAMRERAAEPR